MRFIAILYVNRSGSTLFSRLLSESSDDVFMFPEVAFPLWLLIERARGSHVAAGRLHDLIRSDPRHGALDIPEERLRSICETNSSDDPAKLLVDIATLRLGTPPAAIAFKLEKLIDVIHPLRGAFGDLTLLHIVRDPRAVVNSMLRSPVPEKPGFNMARNSPVFAARRWRDYMRRVRAVEASHPVERVRFEDVCRDPDATLKHVVDRLGLQPRAPSGPRPDRYRISALDGALHGKVFEPPAPERLAAWQAELPQRSVRLVERICWREMVALGYAPARPRLGGASPTLGLAVLRHLAASLDHAARSLLGYVRRPGVLAALRRRARDGLVARRERRRQRTGGDGDRSGER